MLDFAERLGTRLDALADVPVWSLTAQEHRALQVTLAESQAKLDGLKLRTLVEADRSGATDAKAAGTAADGVAGETRQTRREVRSQLRLARRLETYVALAAALDAGRVNAPQARVVVNALDRLPTKGTYALDAEQIRQAETHLVERGLECDADRLQILGHRIFEVIAPATGRLLCPHHHRRWHDPRTRPEVRPDGKVRFHRRT